MMPTPENKSMAAPGHFHISEKGKPDTDYPSVSTLNVMLKQITDAGAGQYELKPELEAKIMTAIGAALDSEDTRATIAAGKLHLAIKQYHLDRVDKADRMVRGGNGPPQPVTKVYVNTGPSE